MNILENFRNNLKQLKKNTLKKTKIEKLETLFMVSLSTYSDIVYIQ